MDFDAKYCFVMKSFRLLARCIIIVDKVNTKNILNMYVSEFATETDYNKALKIAKSLV
jgi:peroxiredoxin